MDNKLPLSLNDLMSLPWDQNGGYTSIIIDGHTGQNGDTDHTDQKDLKSDADQKGQTCQKSQTCQKGGPIGHTTH